MNTLKKKSIFQPFEPILFFAAYFLPGYLGQNETVNPEVFNNFIFNISFSLTALGQIFLLYYMLSLKKTYSLTDYGIVKIKIMDIPRILLLCGGIFLCMLPFSLIQMLSPEESVPYFMNPVEWKITNPAMIPLIFITCICTGYREESFFRSYMLTLMSQKNLPVFLSVLCSTILFSAGHAYQGLLGLAGTALIGIFLSIIFIKTKNLHTIAIAHGLYNFITLMISIDF